VASLRPQRAIWISAAISLLLHIALLSGLPSVMPIAEPTSPTLTARLEAIPPPAPPKVEQPPRPAPPAKKVRPPVPSRVLSAKPAELPPDFSPAALDEPTDDIATPEFPGEVAQAPPAPTPAEPPTPEPGPEAPAPVEQAQPEVELPQTGKITYELFYGSDKFSIGRSVHTWFVDKASYRLTSYSETTGLVGFFRPYQYAYVSEGRIDANGLHPDSLSLRRGPEGEQEYFARFDWEKRELTYGPVASPLKAPLQPGTYDILSFVFQLARMPLEPGRIPMTITTGMRVATYLMDIGQEEDLELPLGTVRAIPIRQFRSSGQEGVELWISADRRRLPLRIRFLDREGNTNVDQLANQIASDGG
jgi:hypothetical protein